MSVRHVLSLLVTLIVLCAVPVQAQPLVSVTLQVHATGSNPATATPVRTATIPLTAFVCNQPPVTPPATTFTPARVEFDDGPNLPNVCIAPWPTFTPVIPVGTGYMVTAIFTDSTGRSSDRSAASNPFSVSAPPLPVIVPPGHLRVLP